MRMRCMNWKKSWYWGLQVLLLFSMLAPLGIAHASQTLGWEFSLSPRANLETPEQALEWMVGVIKDPISRLTGRTMPRGELISDGQFVYGPAVEGFDIAGFLLEQQSPLAPYAAEIDAIARFTSVNPKILLTVLEVRSGMVSHLEPSLAEDEILAEIEETAYQLAIPFYDHLYQWGSRQSKTESLPKGAPSVSFEDGSTQLIDPALSSGTFALASVLAQDQTEEAWQATSFSQENGSFMGTFAEFFPETNLLDSTYSIDPPSLPPDDFFQLPIPLGASWQFNGPHSWCGGDACYNEPPDRSSIDFSTTWDHTDPFVDHYTTAAAAGAGYIRTPYSGRDPCWYEIDHGNGWKTSYYHLEYLGVPGSQGNVNQNFRIGAIGEGVCNGGFASGAHVHFTLCYNGAYYDLDGIKFSGWEVHSGPDPYTTGYLERDGEILPVYSRVRNDYHEYYGTGEDNALYFNGTQDPSVDRLKLPVDAPDDDFPGPPADVGYHDFVVEWWMKSEADENNAPAITCGENDNWKLGHILFDRSRAESGAEWGVSIAGGLIAFGVRGEDGSNRTLCSSTMVTDGKWHHIAIQRNRWAGIYPDGELWLFVDGQLEGQATGPGWDISYPDDDVPGSSCGVSGSEPCTDSDPFLFIGGSKWDTRLSFQGWLDDIRFSWWLRYFTDFTPPESPHAIDSKTVALLRFDEDAGEVIHDTSGFTHDGGLPSGPSEGFLVYGGEPAGPLRTSSYLFKDYQYFIPFVIKP